MAADDIIENITSIIWRRALAAPMSCCRRASRRPRANGVAKSSHVHYMRRCLAPKRQHRHLKMDESSPHIMTLMTTLDVRAATARVAEQSNQCRRAHFSPTPPGQPTGGHKPAAACDDDFWRSSGFAGGIFPPARMHHRDIGPAGRKPALYTA